ncbi:MAG TPA: T9SS type A sorting domain-containing protein, partial [Chitinophagales bacterium]|nr:T9SS type A sorting domain-containing protein [Chitinophagales bacterium]
ITITTTTPGYALAQLDGYCTSSVGDEMLFAVNNVPAWGPNEDHITVSAAYTNNNFSTLAHSRLFYVPAGTHTYYSVVQNFSSSAGNGLVDIMANFTVKFYPDESVGIAETTGSIVAVYPNPVSGILTIALPNNSRQTVTITDLSGRVVQNMETTNHQLLKVDMSYLPAGIYLVKGNGFVKKVVKQ